MRYVDFHELEPKHVAIHERLLNWARWVGVRTRRSVSPMFQQYRSAEHWQGAEAMADVDALDAQRLEKAVYHLPEEHRAAVRWHYVEGSNPAAMARRIGCRIETLKQLVRDARQMLVNRGA